MKRQILLFLGMGFGIALECHAQSENKLQSTFDSWRQEIRQDFEDFRRQCMQEYLRFVEQPWEKHQQQAPRPMPKDEPVPPVIIPKEEGVVVPVKPVPLKIETVIAPLPVMPQPEPVAPIKDVPVVEASYLDCTFFGTPVRVRFEEDRKIRMTGVAEKDVTEALGALADKANDNTIIDCLELRRTMQLCDWAYLQLLKTVGETAYGKGSNEAALFTAYLYLQSGYKMRFGAFEGKLYLLYASRHQIYDMSYYQLDGESYYGLEKLPAQLYICRAQFPKEKSLSLRVEKEPLLAVQPVKAAAHCAEDTTNITASVTANKNRLDFYATYPASQYSDNFVTRWAMCANMAMPQEVRTHLYASLQKAVEGRSQLEAVNYLLNWVQTGFEYEYDETVWGSDRAFFPEESLFYPYCDCEDRAILLTRIVRDLLHLDCILVYYPGHLAAAVAVTEGTPTGDYIEHNGKQFFLMDGTILSGAPVGVTMDGMDNRTATVILLD